MFKYKSGYSWSLKSISILILIDMLLVAEGRADNARKLPKNLTYSSDFRTGRFLTFPLGDRLSPSAKRRQASRSSLLWAWPPGFRIQKRDFSRHLRFLQRCWWRFKSPEMPSVWLWSWRYYAPPKHRELFTSPHPKDSSLLQHLHTSSGPLRSGWPRAISTAVHGCKTYWG
jgi:hypothetical protein